MVSVRKPFHKYKHSKMLIIYFAVQKKIKTNIWILKCSLYSSMAFIFEKSSFFFPSKTLTVLTSLTVQVK